MAASKFILFGTSFIRIQRNSSSTPSSISNLLHSYPHFNKSSSSSSFPSLHLFTNSYCSATASVDELPHTGSSSESSELNESISVSVSHPWPEWVGFINKLKSKGYFDDSSFKAEDDNGGDGGGGGDENFSYNDLNRLKHACLSFARERFDLCKSLSRDDIQTVVKYGCPSLTRKAVNSAKKLRAYVRLDEGDVCSGCTLRGSCDRAYVILKDTEAAARTVDIVRMLMIYAIDPLVHSGEKPNGRDHIETSARKLLAELIDLSETTIDPALPKPAVRAASPKPENVGRERPQNIEMKRGDWMCSNCNFMNFARNIRCLECKTDGPKRVSVNDVEMKKGDWNCPQCQFMNFARNKNCLRCQESRPQRELNPGEWECPKCDFLNYRRNTSCLKCDCDRPKDDAADFEEQIWKRPS